MEKTETEAKKNRRRPAAKKQTGKKKSSSADKIDSISVRKHTITCTDLEYMIIKDMLNSIREKKK